MRTTDSISAFTPPAARKPLRNALTRMLQMAGTVCRAKLFRRRRNSLHALNERQLRDIGLTRDMIDHDIVMVGETEVRIRRESVPFPAVLLLLLARGGA